MKITFIIKSEKESRIELARCFESIERQTLDDVEIIAVGICSNFISCADSVGEAVENSTGEYICIVPGNVCLSPWFCEKMIAMCEEHGTSAAVCGYMETEKNTPLDSIGVPLMLYRSEKKIYDNADDKGFNKILKRCGKLRDEVAYTAEPLVFITVSTDRG